MTGPATSPATAWTASKSPGTGDGEARLDDVHAQRRPARGPPPASRPCSCCIRAHCSPSRRVVSKMRILRLSDMGVTPGPVLDLRIAKAIRHRQIASQTGRIPIPNVPVVMRMSIRPIILLVGSRKIHTKHSHRNATRFPCAQHAAGTPGAPGWALPREERRVLPNDHDPPPCLPASPGMPTVPCKTQGPAIFLPEDRGALNGFVGSAIRQRSRSPSSNARTKLLHGRIIFNLWTYIIGRRGKKSSGFENRGVNGLSHSERQRHSFSR